MPGMQAELWPHSPGAFSILGDPSLGRGMPLSPHHFHEPDIFGAHTGALRRRRNPERAVFEPPLPSIGWTYDEKALLTIGDVYRESRSALVLIL